MDATRRKLFGVIAGVPIAALAAKQAIASAPATLPAPLPPPKPAIVVPDFPVGYLTDSFEMMPDPRYTTATAPVVAVNHRMIWNGTRFVRFDSAEGTAILNRLWQR